MTFPSAAFVRILLVAASALSLWSVVASAELIAVRREFARGKPLGPDLAALCRGRLRPRLLSSPLLSPSLLPIVATLRIAAGVALPIVIGTGVGPIGVAAALLAGIIGATVWLSMLTGGGDGADKIALVASTASLLIAVGLAIDEPWLRVAGLAWGAGQASIAYAASGWAKLVRGFWRDGSALAAAMTGYRSGHGLAAAFVRRRSTAVGLSWTIMLLEALFPLALVAPRPFCLAMLASLLVFHLATAVVMGLNTYPWAFAATYPCVVGVNALLIGG